MLYSRVEALATLLSSREPLLPLSIVWCENSEGAATMLDFSSCKVTADPSFATTLAIGGRPVRLTVMSRTRLVLLRMLSEAQVSDLIKPQSRNSVASVLTTWL